MSSYCVEGSGGGVNTCTISFNEGWFAGSYSIQPKVSLNGNRSKSHLNNLCIQAIFQASPESENTLSLISEGLSFFGLLTPQLP